MASFKDLIVNGVSRFLGTIYADGIQSSSNIYVNNTVLVKNDDSRLSDSRTPKSHNQASSTINAMTGYSKPSSTSAITATDSLNTAIGKLEKAIEGTGGDVSGKMSKTNPSGTGSFSLNRKENTTNGDYSFAEGYFCTASGEVSHAEGAGTTASGLGSHAEGIGTTASGVGSHAEGNGTIASRDCSHVQGMYNVEDPAGKFADIIGKGYNDNDRKNIEATDWDGNKYLKGDIYIDCDDNSTGGSSVKNSLDGKENASNKKTSWTATPTDTNYPSEKLVKDSLDGKVGNGSKGSSGTTFSASYYSGSSTTQDMGTITPTGKKFVSYESGGTHTTYIFKFVFSKNVYYGKEGYIQINGLAGLNGDMIALASIDLGTSSGGFEYSTQVVSDTSIRLRFYNRNSGTSWSTPTMRLKIETWT